MAIGDAQLTTAEDVLRKYHRIGLFGGLALGVVAGIVVVGPHLVQWSGRAQAMALFGCTVLGGVIGDFAASIAAGTHAAGSAACPSGDSGGASDSGGGDGGGDGGGGDS